MNNGTLREYVSLIVEKIRSTKSTGEKFNFDKFRSLHDINAMREYALDHLEMLGAGSSRIAFVLSNRYVLKIALNQAGIAQNKSEVEIYSNPMTKPIIAKVHRINPDNKWVIADVVRPLTSEEEFKQMTGIDYRYFGNVIRSVLGGQTKVKVPESSAELVKATIATMRANNMMTGDVVGPDKFDHWGKTPDGRTVLLDYGFTKEVWSQHYKGAYDRTHLGNDEMQPFIRTQTGDNAKLGSAKTEPHQDTEKDEPDEDKPDGTMKAKYR